MVRGVKWTATAWIHSMPFQPARLRQQLEDRAKGTGERDGEPGMCDNMHTSCDHWASVGVSAGGEGRGGEGRGKGGRGRGTSGGLSLGCSKS